MNICIDLGGTNIKIGVIHNNRFLDYSEAPSFSSMSFEGNMNRLHEMIQKILSSNYDRSEDFNAIGISMPGIIDTNRNLVLSINEKHNEAIHFDFNSWAKRSFNLPLYLENDARAALLGEWQYGAGRNTNNLVMMTLGTGIGGAAMINGKLLYGKHYQAGCLGGHFIVDYNGHECTCGNIGCVEAEASSWNLKRLLKEHPGYSGSKWQKTEDPDFAMLFSQYMENDSIAADTAVHCLKIWSAGVINMIHAYDPEMVIIGGGIMGSHKIILPFISNYINSFAWMPTERVKIEKSELESKAALWGMNVKIKNI